MHSPTIQKLIDLFSKFPTVGPRTASRFVFYLMRLKNVEINDLLKSIVALKKNVKVCSSCFNAFEPFDQAQGKSTFCQICSDARRDKTLLCLVANETDLQALEKTKKYKGLYFVLGGLISRLRKNDLSKLRIKELEIKAGNPAVKEIILAFNSNIEGETTAFYIERLLKPLNKKTTRLGRGLPLGGELEYADEETLSSALEGRK